MRRSLPTLAAMAALSAMAACSHHDGRINRPRPIFSPNGEILSAGGKDAPACPQAMGDWWDRIVAAHGGSLTKDVLVADANVQFDAMDLDHDGFITPSELSDYRAALDEGGYDVIPPGAPGASGDAAEADGQMRRQRRSGGPGGGGGPDMSAPRVKAPQIPADVVDPVMSADKSLSFKVSRDDFLTQAREVFAELDKNHDGKISREELVATCPGN